MHKDSGVSEVLGSGGWVETIGGDRYELTKAIQVMVDRIVNDELQAIPKPNYPSEADWARKVSELCGWL